MRRKDMGQQARWSFGRGWALVLCASAMACGPVTPAPEDTPAAKAAAGIELAFAQYGPARQWGLAFAQEVEARGIHVEVFANGQLGEGKDLAQAVRAGTVDMALVTADAASALAPAFKLVGMPGLFQTLEQRKQAQRDLPPLLDQRLNNELDGVQDVSVLAIGWEQWSLVGKGDAAAELPADNYVRVYGRAPEQAALIEAEAALPQAVARSQTRNISSSELELALSYDMPFRGFARTSEWLELGQQGKIDYVSPAGALPGLSAGLVLIASKRGLSSWMGRRYKDLGQAAQATAERFIEREAAAELAARTELIERLTMDVAPTGAWQAATQVLWRQFAGEVDDGTALLQAVGVDLDAPTPAEEPE